MKAELVILLSELTNLTSRLEIVESGPDKYIKLEFDLLRVELREFESLVTHLKTSLNSSSSVFDSLYSEVSLSVYIIAYSSISWNFKRHGLVLNAGSFTLAISYIFLEDPQYEPDCRSAGKLWPEQLRSDPPWVYETSEEAGEMQRWTRRLLQCSDR